MIASQSSFDILPAFSSLALRLASYAARLIRNSGLLLNRINLILAFARAASGLRQYLRFAEADSFFGFARFHARFLVLSLIIFLCLHFFSHAFRFSISLAIISLWCVQPLSVQLFIFIACSSSLLELFYCIAELLNRCSACFIGIAKLLQDCQVQF